MHAQIFQHGGYFTVGLLTVLVLFVDLIYIVFESMSATVTSPNVVVVLHGRNTTLVNVYVDFVVFTRIAGTS